MSTTLEGAPYDERDLIADGDQQYPTRDEATKQLALLYEVAIHRFADMSYGTRMDLAAELAKQVVDVTFGLIERDPDSALQLVTAIGNLQPSDGPAAGASLPGATPLQDLFE